MSDDGILTIHVKTRPILVASRIRKSMEERGYAALDPGAPKHPEELGILVRRGQDRHTWVHPEFADAVPDDLGARLSHELRCEVTTIIRAGEVTAYELVDQGRRVEKLAVKLHEILEDSGTALGSQVREGAELPTLLTARGLTDLELSFTQALEAPGRQMPLRFAPLPDRQVATETLEIDPLLECPDCASPMQLRRSKYGDFYGCVRFPGCRGRLTSKQAEEARIQISK